MSIDFEPVFVENKLLKTFVMIGVFYLFKSIDRLGWKIHDKIKFLGIKQNLMSIKFRANYDFPWKIIVAPSHFYPRQPDNSFNQWWILQLQPTSSKPATMQCCYPTNKMRRIDLPLNIWNFLLTNEPENKRTAFQFSHRLCSHV